MTTNARDNLDGLRCQVPGCKRVIRAMTGLQEITKMRQHMQRAHLAHLNTTEALELRAAWEERGHQGEKR